MRERLRLTPLARIFVIVAMVHAVGARQTVAQMNTGADVLRIPAVTRAPTLENFITGEPREAKARETGFRQSASPLMVSRRVRTLSPTYCGSDRFV